MPLPPDIFLPMLILAAAAIIKGTFGFGDALIAMPALVLLFTPQEAAPLSSLCGFVNTILVVWTGRVALDWRAAMKLIPFSLAAIPVGAVALHTLPTEILAKALGVLLIAYGLRGLWPRPWRWSLESDRWAWLFGAASGFLGGAFTTGGPPVVIYATLRRWDPAVVRATLSGFFLPNLVVIMASHAIGGLWTPETFTRMAWALPGVITATLIGGKLNGRFSPERFRKALFGLLVVMGGLLVAG